MMYYVSSESMSYNSEFEKLIRRMRLDFSRKLVIKEYIILGIDIPYARIINAPYGYVRNDCTIS
jgi:hypothetical protein